MLPKLECPKCRYSLSFWRDGMTTRTLPFRCSACGAEMPLAGPVLRSVFGTILIFGLASTWIYHRVGARFGDAEVTPSVVLPLLAAGSLGMGYSVWIALRLFCRIEKR